MTSEVIPLAAIPNQSLSIALGGFRFVLTIKEAGGMMAATIERDSVLILEGSRCVSGYPVIPYEYLEESAGNLIFTTTPADEIPYWQNFGNTCFLVWTSQDELDGYRNGL